MTDPVAILEAQDQVIQAQSATISVLFQALMQHIAADELERLPCVVDLSRAEARLREICPAGGEAIYG